MRWLFLFAVLAAPAVAQNAPTVDPDDLLAVLGSPWGEAKGRVAAPDSGRVVGKSGTLLWRSPDREVASLYLVVRRGVAVEIAAAAAPRAAGDFDRFVAEARAELGPPAADGFYRTDPFSGAGGRRDLEVRFDETARTMTIRVPLADQP